MIPLLLLLSCGQVQQPAPSEQPPSAAEPSPPPDPAQAAPVTWTAATIAELQPRPASQQATVPLPLPASPQLEQALATLGAVVDAEAVDPGNPWAIGHGLVARGKHLRLSNGELALDWLFAEYAEPFQADGHTLLRFPESRGSARVEPHADLVLKAVTEVERDPARTVQVAGQEHPLADLWRGSLLRSYLVPSTNHSRYSSPDDVAWSIQGLAAWAPVDLRWKALDGTPMDLDELTDFGAAVLYQETRFLAQAQQSGQPFQRQGQGIFQYTCGGAHLLQGVGLAVARGFGGEQSRRVVQEQSALMLYRFPVEAGIYQQALQAMPQHADQLQVQRLKFAGHYLESMSKLAAWGLWSPREQDLAVLQAAADEVVSATAALQEQGLLGSLDRVRARDEQLYLDIVGDSAHAVHGLELALGRRSVRW